MGDAEEDAEEDAEDAEDKDEEDAEKDEEKDEEKDKENDGEEDKEELTLDSYIKISIRVKEKNEDIFKKTRKNVEKLQHNKTDDRYTYLTKTGKKRYLRYKNFNNKIYLSQPQKWKGKLEAFALLKKKFLKKMDSGNNLSEDKEEDKEEDKDAEEEKDEEKNEEKDEDKDEEDAKKDVEDVEDKDEVDAE